MEIPMIELINSLKNNITILQKSNLINIMKWIYNNTNKCFNIIRNSNLFYYQYLTKQSIFCYIRVLVNEISKLYLFNVSDKIDYMKTLQIENIP